MKEGKEAGKKEGGKEGGRLGGRKKREEIWYLRNIKNADLVRVLPNRACSPECSGSLGHSAYCEKGQGRKVLNTPLDAECLPRSLSDCGLSGACSGLADRLEDEVSRSKQQRKASKCFLPII